MTKKTTPPPVPDYIGAAKQQGIENIEAARATAKLGNPNIYGPLGSQTVSYGTKNNKIDQAGFDAAMADYNKTNKKGAAPDIAKFTSPDFDIPTITQTLTPDAQATLESQQAVEKGLANLGQQGIGTAQNALANPFNPNLSGLKTELDTSQLTQMPTNQGINAQEAIMRRLQPQLTQNENATRQRMANQGLVPGGEAYENEMRIQGQNRNDLESQAALQGINLDAALRQQGLGEQQMRTQFGNEAQQQSLAQQLALRNQPLNEISGLMSGSQIQMPQFQGYTGANIAAPQTYQATSDAYNAAMQQYGIQQNAKNAGMSGMMGLAGSLGGAGLMM